MGWELEAREGWLVRGQSREYEARVVRKRRKRGGGCRDREEVRDNGQVIKQEVVVCKQKKGISSLSPHEPH